MHTDASGQGHHKRAVLNITKMEDEVPWNCAFFANEPVTACDAVDNSMAIGGSQSGSACGRENFS